MKKKASRKFLEVYLLWTLGFLLVTLFGSHMIESQLEKDISADLYQSAYRIQKMRISGIIFPLPALTASEKSLLWLQTIPIPSSDH